MRYTLADVQDLMFNRPVAISRERAQVVLGAMGPRLNIGSLVIDGEGRQIPIGELAELAAQARVDFETRPGDRDLARRNWETGAIVDPYEIWNGVAILKVRGTLMPEGGLDPASGMTSYSGLDYKLRYAAADDRVLGIVMDHDSGGGAIIDLFELCAQIRAVNEIKPIRSIIRGTCASADYALACSGSDITCADYSLVGSIGCLIAHAEFSRKLEQDGIGVTLITSASHKADGSSALPLADDVRERLQAEVDRSAATFVAHVAECRDQSIDAVAGQEARFYGGVDALGIGLVDHIMAWDDSLKEFAEAVNRRQPSAATQAPAGMRRGANRGEARMSREDLAPAADNQPVHTQAALEAAVATATSSATAAAQTAERERVTALVELDAESNVSEPLAAAISAGTSAGDFAIARQKASREQQAGALDGARADAARGTELPSQRRPDSETPPNRGEAAVSRMRGKHKGLPATA